MGRRFSDLEDVYATLNSANFDFNSLPSTNKYRKYKEWKEDPDQRKLPEGSAQETGARKRAGVQPFGLPDAPKILVDVGISGRAFNALGDLGGAPLYNLTVEVSDDLVPKPGFQPAKAILALKRASAVAVPASENRITGRAYKKRTGESYTVPFGRKAATDTAFNKEDEILATKGTTHAISFKPEKLGRR